MMYRPVKYARSVLPSVEKFEGETIEMKMQRILDSGEPITDGAPEIYTERKDGVIAAYNIRTDRFEIAAEAMDKVSASIAASRDNLAGGTDLHEGKKESKVVNLKSNDDAPKTGESGA